MTETPSQPHEDPLAGEQPADGSTRRPADHTAQARHAIVDELRVLRRSSSDRVVAGVMGGLGVRLGIDPVVLRIVTAVLALFGGVGILIYAIAWLLVPADDEAGSVLDQALGRVEPRRPNAAPLALGLGLAALVSAGFVVGGSVVSGPLLVGAAAAGYLLLHRRDERADAERATAPSFDDHTSGDLPRSWPSDRPLDTADTSALYAPAEEDSADAGSSRPWAAKDDGDAIGKSDDVGGDPQTATDASDGSVESPADERADSDVETPPGVGMPQRTIGNTVSDADDATAGSGWPDGPDWAPPPPPSDDARWAVPDPGEPAVPTKTKRRSPLGAFIFCAALVAVGILAIVDSSTNFPVGLYFAVPLAVIGLGLVIGSFFGRSRGLIALGIVLALALIPAKFADEWGAGEWGRQATYEYSTLSQLPDDTEEFGGGQITYDLSNLDLRPSDVGTLSIDMGGGELTIFVPPEADLDVDASLGMGEFIVRSDRFDGFGSEFSRTFDGEGVGEGTIELNINMGGGSVKVVDR